MAKQQLSSSVTNNETNATAKPKRSRAKKPAAPVQLDMAIALDTRSAPGNDDLDALLMDLGAAEVPESASVEAVADEVLLDAAEAAELIVLNDGDDADDALLEAAVTSAEATEISLAAVEPTEDDGSAPTDLTPEEKAPAKRKSIPRKHYSDKVERLKDRMGASMAEFSVLTTADVADDADIAAVMERTLEIIHGMNSKEKNRASNLMEFLSGKRSSLNNVLDRVLRVLERDGFLQTGNDGNVFKDLLSRPYSPASARAMGGNTVSMYADLKLILPVEGQRGRFAANPDSLLLAKARSMLMAAKPAAAEADGAAATE